METTLTQQLRPWEDAATRIMGGYNEVFVFFEFITNLKKIKYLVDLFQLVNYYDEITRFDYYIGEVIKKLKDKGAFENTGVPCLRM